MASFQENIKNIFLLIIKPVRKDLRIKIVIFIFGIILWSNINLEQIYETDIVVPIKTTGLSKNMTFLEKIPEEARVKIKGNGKVLMLLDKQEDLFFNLDISTVEGRANFFLNDAIFINKTADDIELLSVINPEFIPVALDTLERKKVPIKVDNININLLAGYVTTGKLSIKPDSIIISGPQTKLKSIEYVETDKLSLKDTEKPVETEISLKLKNSDIIDYSHEKVEIYQNIVRKGSYKFKKLIRLKNVPLQRLVSIDPISVEIEVIGPVTELYNVADKNFEITANYRNTKNDSISLTFDVDTNLDWNVSTKKVKVIEF